MIEAYGSLYWFYILGLATVPAIVLGLLGKRLRSYTRVATVVMVVLMLGWATGQLWWLLGFLVFELALVKGWLRYRVGHPHVNPWIAGWSPPARRRRWSWSRRRTCSRR